MDEREGAPPDTSALHQKIEQLAKALHDVAESISLQLPAGKSEPVSVPQQDELTPSADMRPDVAMGRFARKLRHARHDRDLSFPVLELFNDPAWDILLDIFVAHAQDKYISITDATLSSHVPTTTALRWVWALEKAGIVERKPDPTDKRRRFVLLTERGLRYMRQALTAIGERLTPPLYS